MLAFQDALGAETGLGGMQGKRVEVDIEPIERVALHLLVFHPEIDLAIIACLRVGQEVARLVLEEVAQVARVHQDAAARVQEVFHPLEKGVEVLDPADDARAVHQHQYGVEGVAPRGVEQVRLAGIEASLEHDARREGRDVDRHAFLAHLLEGQRVAAASRARVQDFAPRQPQGLALDGRHLVVAAEKGAHGDLVLVEQRGEDFQAGGAARLVVVEDGLAHRVLVRA